MNFDQISYLLKLILKVQFFVLIPREQISQGWFTKCVARGLYYCVNAFYQYPSQMTK